MIIPKDSACYTCRGCYNRMNNPKWEPKNDINCDSYLPADPKNHFMDNIINDWGKKHGKDSTK